MKTILSIVFLFAPNPIISCEKCGASNSAHQISRLFNADKQKNIAQLRKLFTQKAIIVLPDSPPVVGIEAISGLYKFIWNKNRQEQQSYIIDSVQQSRLGYFEYGKTITCRNNQHLDTTSFRASFVNLHGKYLISELNFGNTNLQDKIPRLPKPSGEFNVGRATFFYDKKETSINRLISFQLWYPTLQETGEKYDYRTPQEAESAAHFHNWPLFANSFTTLIRSHSLKNPPVIKNQQYPVLIYNHGYGGFTGVYQSVCEDLASHGYIVVSLGHQDESALLMLDDRSVLSNSSDNDFYVKRNHELNGAEINQLQSIILNSNNKAKVKNAYTNLLIKSPLHNQSVELWTNDVKETILKLELINLKNSTLKGSLNLENIGVFGHSVGGATAGELSSGTNQIKAGINLDGFQFGNLINNRLQIPFLFVSSNSVGDTYLRITPFRSTATKKCHHIVLKDFTHDMFSDLAIIMNNDSHTIKVQRSLILNFFDKYLKHKEIDLTRLEEEFQELSFN